MLIFVYNEVIFHGDVIRDAVAVGERHRGYTVRHKHRDSTMERISNFLDAYHPVFRDAAAGPTATASARRSSALVIEDADFLALAKRP
jgi:hypothetical protein